MYVISCRRRFWDNDRVRSRSKPDLVAKIDLNGNMTFRQVADYHKKIANKKVLLLCHGYRNQEEDVRKAYYLIKRKHKSLINYFDVVFGYTWPGGEERTDYAQAKDRVTSAVAGRFAKLLQHTIPKCSQLGVMAHSMGCRISLISHTQLYDQGFGKGNCSKHWQFLMAAAVDDDSIERGERYYGATQYCDKTYVFHSKRDGTVRFAYRVGEGFALGGFDGALGSKGPENPSGISEKTNVINCKRVISEHGDYKRTNEVYDYIRNELYGDPAPQFSQM